MGDALLIQPFLSHVHGIRLGIDLRGMIPVCRTTRLSTA
jgi:hypothetical protein